MSGVLRYESGTLVLEGTSPPKGLEAVFAFDARVNLWRAPAYRYPEIVPLLKNRIGANRASQYRVLALERSAAHAPYLHQLEGLAAWRGSSGRGIVVLPTGAGKTELGLMAMEWASRSTLVVVPTRVLMHQWYAELKAAFPDLPVGLIGDGEHEPFDLAVATYDSAAIHAEKLGNRYGLLIFDEVHHLPTEFYEPAATFSLAPYRLGLTASLERADLRHERLYEYVGPVVYRRAAAELRGGVLADYRIEEVRVELSRAERENYQKALELRNAFLEAQRISLGSLEGWSQFVKLSARTEEGRRAMRAHREASRIATAAPAKLRALGAILARHPGQKVLVFTKENELAYEVSRRYLIPCITHQTHVKERQATLEKFAQGEYRAVVSGNVLNEGINVADASVAVNLSGSAVERELIQRLGRILRRMENKTAVFYEVFTRDTREQRVSERRRGLGQGRSEWPQKPPEPPEVVSQERLLPALSWDELGKD
ncbi:MAG: helicase [Meiothermus sp.]